MFERVVINKTCNVGPTELEMFNSFMRREEEQVRTYIEANAVTFTPSTWTFCELSKDGRLVFHSPKSDRDPMLEGAP